uniref:Nuclease HARBI1 n=1 Tax=Petromyzon marinus TaxID=7757 RepID=A0AAJ7T7U4_PETMA|nr:putative nuclease HARBI1 [Petromyzon marinus]
MEEEVVAVKKRALDPVTAALVSLILEMVSSMDESERLLLSDSEAPEDDDLQLMIAALLCRQGSESVASIIQSTEELIPQVSPDVFRHHFHVSRQTFDVLASQLARCPEFPTEPYHGGRPPIPLTKVLLVALWTLATPECLRTIGERFGIPRSSVLTCLRRVCAATINNLMRDYLVWPSPDEFEGIAAEFERQKGFPGIIGALDVCHIAIKAPTLNPENYYNRKGFFSLVLQAVCDANYKFLDCFTGWPGCITDFCVLKKSPLFEEAEQTIPLQYHMVADSAYYLKSWLMTPYRETGMLSDREQKFNFVQMSTTSVIERAFAMLKGRFCRLKYLDMSDMNGMVDVIMTACVFHNICLLHETELDDFADESSSKDVAIHYPTEDIAFQDDAGERKREEIANLLGAGFEQVC